MLYLLLVYRYFININECVIEISRLPWKSKLFPLCFDFKIDLCFLRQTLIFHFAGM